MTTKDLLAKELEKIGLTDSEAKVYLGSLELGPDTAQHIAAKASVSRPTTYIMIENLMKRGLMSKFKKGKKWAFAAAAPHQLLYVITNQQEELRKKEEGIRGILAQFDKLVEDGSEKPHVYVAEGVEAVRQLQQDILATSGKDGDTVYEITSLSKARKHLPPKFEGDRRNDIGKKFKVKSLYASSEETLPAAKNVESRRLDPKEYPISGEIVAYGDKVALTAFGDKVTVVTVTNPDIAQTVKTLFNALWESSKK